MAARNLYPAPECPKCGKNHINRVKNTYYTDDGRICRTRQCELLRLEVVDSCSIPRTTSIPPPPLVRIERWGKSTGSKKQVQIINV